MTTIGIIGPRDLVVSTARLCRDIPGLTVAELPYRRETDTPGVISGAPADIDAWLFTGIVPYEIASAAGLLDRPAMHVEYTGPTLLAALVGLLRDGRDVTAMSIDTLAEEQVQETLDEVRLPTTNIEVLPYRLGLESADLVDFHRAAAGRGAQVAITCLRSAYDALRGDRPTVRLAPSVHSVRNAVHRLLLLDYSRRSDDAQVALGLVKIDAPGPQALSAEVAELGANVVRYDAETFLVVTTRGPLEQVTGAFTELPMLARLQEVYGSVRIGFGIGGSGAEADALARRALGRAHSAGAAAAVLSLRNDIDITLARSQGAQRVGRPSLDLLAQRAGLSVATLRRLRELIRTDPEVELTTRVVSDGLDVQLRTARRMLNRLERAGLATPVGTQTLQGSGRPLVIYRVQL